MTVRIPEKTSAAGWKATAEQRQRAVDRLRAELEASLRSAGIMAERIRDQDDEIKRLRAALETSMTAIDDWLNLFASEHCRPERVLEAEKRVHEHGTLFYIATVQEQNRKALASDQQSTISRPEK